MKTRSHHRSDTYGTRAPRGPRGAAWALAIALCTVTPLVGLAETSNAMPEYPSKPYASAPVEHVNCFETLCDLTIAGGNPADRAARYVWNELALMKDEGVGWTQWSLVQKDDQAHHAGLTVTRQLPRLPRAITLEVRNESPRAARIGLVLGEMAWQPKPTTPARQWLLPPKNELGPGERAVLRYPVSEAVPTEPVDRERPLCPVGLSLFVADSGAGDRISLLFRDLQIEYGVASGVTEARLVMPETIHPETLARLELDARSGSKGTAWSLELRRQGHVLWRSLLDEAESADLDAAGEVALTREMPWYVGDGPAEMILAAEGYQCASAVVTVVGARAGAFPRVERRLHHGRPTVFVDGEPFSWSGYASYDFSPGNVGEFGASGANLFCVAAAAGRHIHNVARATWLPGDVFDFGDLDERVAMALQANPEARLLPRVSLDLPPWWIAAHPESGARIRTENGDVLWEETGAQVCTMTSEAWRTRQAEVLRAFIRHCAAKPWAERVIGFVISGGVTEEWFAWGANDAQYGDYSASNQDAFKAWCADRGLPFVEMPQPGERQAPGRDLFADTLAGRAAAAYAQFASTSTADTIAYFARVVKEESAGRCLAGALYGYVLQLAEPPRQHLAGNFDVQGVLAEPEVDFLMGIPLHNYRDLTHGYDLHVSATESILAAGKFYLNENDLFSWLHHAIWYREYNPDNPLLGATYMHRRVLANDAVHGCPRQWFSLIASWHSDPDLQAEFAREIDWQRLTLGLDRSGAEEVAFLVDDTSFAWYTPETALPRRANIDMLHAFGRTGVPVGVWLLSDIDRLPDRIRFVIVAHAPAARADDIAKLERAIAAGGRTFVVTGPVGLINPATQAWDAVATARVTGLPVEITDDARTGGVAMSAGGGAVYPDEPVCPRASVSGGGLAAYVDGAGAMAERALANGGRLIWSGVPVLNNRAARAWYEAAGVHCYAPLEFTVHASRELVGITAPEGQTVTLSWPDTVTVTDLFTGWSAEGAQMTCGFEDGQTRLFRVE